MLGQFFKSLIRHRDAGVLRAQDFSAADATGQQDFAHGKVFALDNIHCLVRARHGWFLANRFDRFLGAALIQYGEYAELELRFLLSLLKLGDTVIEVGSNIGSHTVALARALGDRGLLVAYEPQPPIYRTLCANLALNAITSVQTHQLGVGARAGQMSLPIEAAQYLTRVHNSGGVELGEGKSGIPVEVVALDEHLSHLQSIRLIKIDVEGMEAEVLRGAGALIKKHRPLLFVENDRLPVYAALNQQILALDYRIFWLLTHLFNPENFFESTHNDTPDVASINMICVPKELPLPFHRTLEEVTEPSQRPSYVTE